MLWQLRCHCKPDQYDKFSSTVVAIFPNVCLWRRSLCSNLAFTLKNCIEPPSYASTAYVVAIWPSFLFDSFVKIWDTCENFLGKWFTAPPGKKFLVRLWLPPCRTSIKGNSWTQHEMETMKAPWSMSAKCCLHIIKKSVWRSARKSRFKVSLSPPSTKNVVEHWRVNFFVYCRANNAGTWPEFNFKNAR